MKGLDVSLDKKTATHVLDTTEVAPSTEVDVLVLSRQYINEINTLLFKGVSERVLTQKLTTLFALDMRLIPQSEITALVKSVIVASQTSIDQLVDSFMWSAPHQASLEMIDSGVSIYAKLYRAVFDLARDPEFSQSRELSELLSRYSNHVSQDPQMIGPKALWQLAKDTMWRKDIPSYYKSELMGWMSYALEFMQTPSYKNELKNQLNFTDVTHYAETAHTLEALKSFWEASHDGYDEDRDVPNFYVEVLRDLEQKPESNYLLSLRAREILSVLEQSEVFPTEVSDVTPFELSKGIFASAMQGKDIKLIPAEQFDHVISIISQYNENEALLHPPQWMVDDALARGDQWLQWQPPADLISNRRHLFSKMHSLATDPIPTFVGYTGADSEENTQALFDYEYLISRPVREIIQKEFNFNLAELTIREQFYFLNYLKHTTVASVETMKLFVGNYGIAALRAFLVGGYDENAAENIMAFGVVTEADTAKPAFEAYAGTLDAAEQFTNNIEKSIASPEVKALLHEVQEGLLKRAGHLFNAGKQMALWEYSGKENIPELISAFKGVARMEDILSRIGTDSSLVYTRNNDREGSRNPLYDMGSNTFFFDIQDSVNNEKVQLKVFIRPTANQEGEARINFELYLEDLDENSELKKAFTQTIISRNKKKTVTRSVIRFGFDLDTITNPPRFSFDMGRHTFADDTMERTGDVLGNILEQVAPEGHNMTDFDPKFSDPKNFAQIAEAFKKYFKIIALEAGQ